MMNNCREHGPTKWFGSTWQITSMKKHEFGNTLKNKGILYCYGVITCKQWWTIAESMAPQSGLVQHGKLQLMNKKTILNIPFYVKYTENYTDN